MVWQAVGVEGGLDLGQRPVGEWIDLELAVDSFDTGQVCPRVSVITLSAGDPAGEADQRAIERDDLAQEAAMIGIGPPKLPIPIELRQLLGVRANDAEIGQAEPLDQ